MGLIHTYIIEKSTSAKGNKMRTRNVLAKSKDDAQNLDALFDICRTWRTVKQLNIFRYRPDTQS
jgi:hypothetical protein